MTGKQSELTLYMDTLAVFFYKGLSASPHRDVLTSFYLSYCLARSLCLLLPFLSPSSQP